MLDSIFQAGAQIVPAGTAEGDVVMAIKEIPIGEIPDRGAGPPRTYLLYAPLASCDRRRKTCSCSTDMDAIQFLSHP
jgi:hypothetical protein